MMAGTTIVCARCGHDAQDHDELGCAVPTRAAGSKLIYCACERLLVRVPIWVGAA